MRRWRRRSNGSDDTPSPFPRHFPTAAAAVLVGVVTLVAGDALETVIRVTPSADDATAEERLAPLSTFNARPRALHSRHELPADGFNFVSAAEAGGKRPLPRPPMAVANRYQQDSAERVAPQSLSSTTSTAVAGAAAKKSRYGNCLMKYHPSSCKRTDYCGTKKMCVQITGDPCCAPADGECPTPAQLDIRCVKGSPINWCIHHNDCARGALCCDTGCDYNICADRFESS